MLFLAFLIFSPADFVQADELKEFTTDGCSLFPDGAVADRDLWLDCCIDHDYAYWQGGTRDRKKAADDRLEQCVADLGYGRTAFLMRQAVRFGGLPYWPTWFRWGYGWEYMRGFKPLTEEEKEQVIEKGGGYYKRTQKID